MGNATNSPVSDRIIRERTFEIISMRDDKKDALGQLVITLDQILKKGFVGQIILNCNGSGAVSSIQVKETTKP